MAAVVLSALLVVAVHAPAQTDPRTTGPEVAQDREIVEGCRRGRTLEAIREVETLSSKDLSDDLKATAAAFRYHPLLVVPGIDERLLRTAAMHLVGETGGLVLIAGSGGLQEAFARVVDELRSRDVLTCSPKDIAPAGWHTIEVT